MKTTNYKSLKKWGIAVGCGFVNCMIKLPLSVSPMLFVAFVDRYATDRQNAALFMTVCVLLRCFTGPLTGFLGEIIDLGHLTSVGCLVAALGTACCYISEDIIAITIFLGLIFGLGNSLAQPLLPQIIKQHLTKNIANANGVSNSVSSVLTFALVPVISILMKHYDVLDALLITSGIMLHGVPMAMLLKNPEFKNLHVSLPAGLKTDKTVACKIEKNQSTITEIKPKLKDSIVDSTLDETHSPFLKHIAESTELEKSTVTEYKAPSSAYQQNKNCVYDIEKETIETKNHRDSIQETIANNSIETSTSVEVDAISEEKHCNTYNPVLKRNPLNDQPPTSRKQNKYGDAFKTLRVLKDPSFLVITLCQSLQAYISVFLGLIIIDISRDKGFPQSQEYLFLMFSPIAEIVGHTCLGWVTDKGYLTAANFISICFLCKGITFGTFILSNNNLVIMISFWGFGLCYAAFYSATPSLVYEFIEEKHQTMAIASRLLLYTPLIFTMAPLIEYFRGTLGSYDGALYLLTGICLVCAVLLLLLPSIAKCSNRKK